MGRPAGPATPGLLDQVVCPYCWHEFPPVRTRWVGTDHPDVPDDAKLGRGYPRRFDADRFTATGLAIDTAGGVCHDLACPECHLVLPRACLELPPMMLSVFGREGSGKSYFLAAMVRELNRRLQPEFDVSFGDADTALNVLLNENISSVYKRADGDAAQPLTELIRKTQEMGEQYHTVKIGGRTQSFLQPFLFTAQPLPPHPLADPSPRRSGRRQPHGRTVCVYDNAGESFAPGADRSSQPVTRHLGQSEALLFIFDPTQETTFSRDLHAPQAGGADVKRDQLSVLQEAGKRVRQFAMLSPTQRDPRPLIVVITKCDAWHHNLEPYFERPLWRRISAGRDGETINPNVLDMPAVEALSKATRSLLGERCGEIVNAAENLSEDVTYVPVSAVGDDVEFGPDGAVCVRSDKAAPINAMLPFLVAAAKSEQTKLIMKGGSRAANR